MNDALKDIVIRLRDNQYKNEEHIRLGVVYRLLNELGWDIWNPQEVCTEFQAIRREDATRVDIALFLQPLLNRPDVFIEVKALGKLMPMLNAAEIQLRDYNRDNQAAISILTDGRHWRLYLSNASGEFSRRCFEQIDLLDSSASLGDAELTLDAFLSKQAIQSGVAVEEAKKYLKRTDVERIMYEVLPVAQRDAEDDPAVSLVDCFLTRCTERGADSTRDQALAFIKTAKTKISSAPLGNILRTPIAPAQQPEKTFPVLAAKNVDRVSKNRLRLNNKRAADAEGVSSEAGRFVVFANSIAAVVSDGFSGGYRNLRSQLENDRTLVPTSQNGLNAFQLSRDYEFSSASAAASVFCGRSANGGEWK